MVELAYLSLKKTTFFVHIFDISHCVFTQISTRRAHWMRNLIPHPRSTHTSYFWRTPLPQKQEIPEKTWWWCHHHVFLGISCFWGIITFFMYFLFWGYFCPSKVCWVGTRWIQNLIPHPMISPDQNLSNNTGRYVENTNKKIVFSFFPPKLINIILLF